MKYKNMLLLLISSMILAGCDPQPVDEKNQQPEHTTQQPATSTANPQEQAAAREATAKAIAEAKAAKAAADAKAAEAEALVAELNADKRSLQGSVRYAARAEAPAGSNTARYPQYEENTVKQVAQNPLATFSLDVDTGSYANVRRFLNQGQLPPPEAVRVEELVNYFPSDWATSVKRDKNEPIPACRPIPFAIRYELASAPWNEQRTLLKVDILARDIKREDLPAANLVFLIDTSGSMNSNERLPLIKSSLKLLVNELRSQDRIAIVTYSGYSRIALPTTAGDHKKEMNAAIDSLNAEGSTNGGAGLKMAYQQAKKGFIDGGVNRILLTTDGDFNVGIADPKDIESMVKKERDSGVTLSTLGVGNNNYNEAMMVKIADIGNGNYSYIDTLAEAQKVFNSEMHQTLVTVAKDVKAQIEFNPAWVTEYRQIGYEKRQLRAEDFNHDKVDAGDIGAGKQVTLLFELTLNGQKPSVDKLRYAGQKPEVKANELAWLKLRWKYPQAKESQLEEFPVAPTIHPASEEMLFNAAVAAYGQKLRGSEYLAETPWQQIKQWAQQAKGKDPQGYRAEFIRLVGLAEGISRSQKEN